MAVAALALLFVELRRSGSSTKRPWLVAASGLVAVASLLLAVLRPVSIRQRGAAVGARVTVLLDASRSIDLPASELASGPTRRQKMDQVLRDLSARYQGVRVRYFTFSAGKAKSYSASQAPFGVQPELASDLSAALVDLAAGVDEIPDALVVVSDGRLDRPGMKGLAARVAATFGEVQPPIHTVRLASKAPADAALRSVRLANAVVAHQPAMLKVEAACVGGAACKATTVAVKELHLDQPANLRASGQLSYRDGRGDLELEVTLDRAGKRILEVSLQPPAGDSIAANDKRYIMVDVARDRVRLLHIAGRPTYDVRALRRWIKSDASADVVAFFILRSHSDNVVASQDELALIPFPVDELFTKHLPSFDAIILQDFDAAPYGLTKHLRRLTRYVRQGGGVIMVGGPNAFVSGNYAATQLATVLPVSLAKIPKDKAIDRAGFEPRLTLAGRRAPVLEPLRSLLGERLPVMPGTNIVGAARPGATVLLEHPTRRTAAGQAMPVLALGEYGSGRTIALTIDGSHKLLFSNFAASAAGRGHGVFWDAMLGWLMRDPRFEPARVTVQGGCIAGQETRLRVKALFGEKGTKARLVVQKMGDPSKRREHAATLEVGGSAVVPVGRLEPGGYTVTVGFDDRGQAAPSRYDFACEEGGDEWADVRPDNERLRVLARATGGVSVPASEVKGLPLPRAAHVVIERHVNPILPPWAWSLFAALCLGGHWFSRRRAGLA